MSEGQLFEHTVGQGKVKGDTEEELSKAQEEFEKSRIERMVSQDDNEILHASGLYHVYESKSIEGNVCLLYTSPSPRDATLSRMPSSA